MLGDEQCFNNRSQKELKQTCITHSPGGSNPSALRDNRGGQGRVRTERKARPRVHDFIRVHVWSDLGVWLRPDWSIQTKSVEF